MAMAASSNPEEFRSAFGGTIFEPGDDGYDEARSPWNGDIDHRPVLIARCSSPGDVALALDYAASKGLEVSVRGGAHSYRGTAVTDGGVMIDLSALNTVVVDVEAKTARVGGGTTLATLDAATQEHGLAAPAGVISHTGVAGLTLGGGMGWLTRLAGLSIDNLLSAEVVLANGEVVRASAESHPDLFWGLRGGGGNFGVVTEFEFRLYEIGPMISFGMFFWGLESGREVLRLARDYIPTLPPNSAVLIGVGLSAPPAPFVPEEFHGRKGHALLVVGYGPPDDHAEMVSPLREQVPPLFEFLTPMPFTALQQLFDEDAPWGVLGYEKSLDIDDLSDEVIDVLADLGGGGTSPMSFLPIFSLAGRFTEISEDDTAFGGSRSPHYTVNIEGASHDREIFETDRAWVRSVFDALSPYASNVGGYVNFMAEADADRVRTSYGPDKYDRLAAVKATYDPGNVFHLNANIKPALT
ncbi:MAG: FAD-binding oxidoreductase [Nocardiaceae bacterium]|nr:FAD-binding oxidoreductase [Nocardiaceae bacterium]